MSKVCRTRLDGLVAAHLEPSVNESGVRSRAPLHTPSTDRPPSSAKELCHAQSSRLIGIKHSGRGTGSAFSRRIGNHRRSSKQAINRPATQFATDPSVLPMLATRTSSHGGNWSVRSRPTKTTSDWNGRRVADRKASVNSPNNTKSR